MMQKNGSEILVECLLEQGVDTVFGYPGGSVLNIYDALYKYSDRITHVLTAHEQGAAHAGGRLRPRHRRVGVCIATSGPGATNLVTGIATAYMDSIPMVAITATWLCPSWPGFVSGGGYHRHHHAGDQIQFHRQASGGLGGYRPQSLYHCEKRPSRPGAGGYSQGRDRRPGGIRAGTRRACPAPPNLPRRSG